jgi:hypothetical protein
MSTVSPTLPVRRKPHNTTIAAGLGALVAIAVAVVFLTTLGSSRTGTTRHTISAVQQSSVVYPPMIQYRGTGAAPVIRHPAIGKPQSGKDLSRATVAGAPAESGSSLPPRKSYGAVP